MKTLLRVVGTGLAMSAGMLVFDLAVQDGLIGQTLPLLLILLGQFGAGGILGFLTRSWRAVAILPVAYVAGFIAASANAGSSAGADQLSALAAGNELLATVFVLALLCSLLAIGTAIGATHGIRMDRMRQRARRHQRQMRATQTLSVASMPPLASQIPVADQSSHVAMPAERELAPAGR
jgi:hypothetical protein